MPQNNPLKDYLSGVSKLESLKKDVDERGRQVAAALFDVISRKIPEIIGVENEPAWAFGETETRSFESGNDDGFDQHKIYSASAKTPPVYALRIGILWEQNCHYTPFMKMLEGSARMAEESGLYISDPKDACFCDPCFGAWLAGALCRPGKNPPQDLFDAARDYPELIQWIQSGFACNAKMHSETFASSIPGTMCHARIMADMVMDEDNDIMMAVRSATVQDSTRLDNIFEAFTVKPETSLEKIVDKFSLETARKREVLTASSKNCFQPILTY